ncbi:MAG TPA: ATP-dependent 6-phosphofructokinase [Candidatus Omnitrophota bacterium]|nr:ATP-dependent 6-phosphofructokinase [Candidatus Omnitrophota bacterium]HPD83912.1 ATP-dependent 6-phosphofructokinase [Candidatus Omnitrophota bacterium]HRZ02769.1 ATP-dependent 6-phosphofructokinase [Candidatus Omnitrophota bacterium]
MKKIGILTGGADCPGLNSVIRAVVRKGMQEGYVVTGIKNGWTGLIDNDMRILDLKAISGILDRGGTILGTSRMNPLKDPQTVKVMKENYKRSGIDALIAVGGEDTLTVAFKMHQEGLKIVGVPKSIDNVLSGTDYTFGFDTAVNIAAECIDRLHTTAESHHRIMVVEVMGRYTGWVAVEAGIAGGADFVLIPEMPINIQEVCDALRNRHKRGKTFSIIVVAEGAQLNGRCSSTWNEDENNIDDFGHRRYGGIGELLAKTIEKDTGYETRVSVLGHIQRGGSPSAFDRVLGTRFGVKAVDLVKEGKFGKMVSLHSNKIRYVDIEEAVSKRKTVDLALYDIAKVFFAE